MLSIFSFEEVGETLILVTFDLVGEGGSLPLLDLAGSCFPWLSGKKGDPSTT